MDSASGSVPMFLTTKQAAAHLRLKPSTLDHWRSTGGGPVFHKLGSRIYYTRADLQAWIESRRRRTTAEHKAKRSSEAQRQRGEQSDGDLRAVPPSSPGGAPGPSGRDRPRPDR